jgi:hypothetical protein
MATDLMRRHKRPVANVDLLIHLFELPDTLAVESIKVPAHRKASCGIDYNREADKYIRKIAGQSGRNFRDLD